MVGDEVDVVESGRQSKSGGRVWGGLQAHREKQLAFYLPRLQRHLVVQDQLIVTAIECRGELEMATQAAADQKRFGQNGLGCWSLVTWLARFGRALVLAVS